MAGDFVLGPKTVVEAVASARSAVSSILLSLAGDSKPLDNE